MITNYKQIKESVQRLLLRRKTTGNLPKSWKSSVDTYGRKSRKEPEWLKLLKKKFASVLPKKKRKSYLSRSEKRKKYGVTALKVVTVTFCTGAAILVLSAPVKKFAYSLDFFKIKEINIEGCKATTPHEIREAAGFDYNTSILAVSPEEISERLNRYPRVKNAVVTRLWPDGVSIKVSEHRAQAIMVTGVAGQEKMVYINSRGDILAQVQPGEELDFPVVNGANNLNNALRESLLADTLVFLQLIGNNDPNLPAQSVSEIYLDQQEGMVIRLVDFPFPIYFGKGNVNKKYRQLRNVLAVLYKKRKNNVDISQVEFIRMDYINDKVLVAQNNSG